MAVEELTDFDQKRLGNTQSNKEREHPTHPDALVTNPNSGATDMALCAISMFGLKTSLNETKST